MSKAAAIKKLVQEGKLAAQALLKEANLPLLEKIPQKIKTPSGFEKFSPENQKQILELLRQQGSTPERISKLAEDYISKAGLSKTEIPKVQNIKDLKKGQNIAQAFEELQHNPDSPEVQKAYKALTDETVNQFEKLKESGLKISRITPGQENPYKSSADLIKDVTENNHMWYFPTEQGFGSGAATTKHPLLAKTGIKDGDQELLANDVFRIVHDYFGHVQGGNKFGAVGEENAWRAHMPMFTQDAQKALTTETRGQNSWVNFGPKGEANRANPANTIYADQKAGILPEWARVPAVAMGSTNTKMSIEEPARQLADLYKENIQQPISDVAKVLADKLVKQTNLSRLQRDPESQQIAEQYEEKVTPVVQGAMEMAADPTNFIAPVIGIPLSLGVETMATPEEEKLKQEKQMRLNAINSLRKN